MQIAPPEWAATAPCKSKGHLFFPPHGERPEARWRRYEQAVAICQTCPHTQACSDYADANKETDGIWGGVARNGKPQPVSRGPRIREIGRKVRNPSCGTYRGYSKHVADGTTPCQPCIDAMDIQRARYRQYDKERRRQINAELTELRARRGRTA